MQEMYRMIQELHQTLVPSKDMTDENFTKLDDSKQRDVMEKEVMSKPDMTNE